MVKRINHSREMEPSWLVQRLRMPAGGPLRVKDNPFSFGGGLRNGGLSPQAMDMLRGAFSFDYMGAAEFEWGAVPDALRGLALDEKKLTAFTFDVALAVVPANWRARKEPTPSGTAPIFVLCRKSDAEEVQRRITAWATGDEHLKESTRLASSLRPYDKFDDRVGGWLELNNGFFFFTDETMWARTSALFGVAAAVSA